MHWIQGAATQYRRGDREIVWDGIYVDITSEKLGEVARQERERLTREELAIAGELQKRLFWRARAPSYLQVATSFRPVSIVSGDLLFCRVNRRQELVCFVGDVSGHGVVAGLLTMVTTAFLELSEDDLNPGQLLGQLNSLLSGFPLEGRYVSGIVAKIGPDGSLAVSNAGHPPAFVQQGSASMPAAIESMGLPLGMFRDQTYGNEAVALGPGDTILLYTDGVYEWTNERGEQFGIASVARTLAASCRRPVDGIVDDVIASGRNHAGSRSFEDDLSLVAIRYRPA